MSLHFKIIQPTRVVFDSECDHLIIPGVEGDFGVFPGHTPFITAIRPGTISIYKDDSVDKIAIHDGFVTVEQDNVRIVAEVVETSQEIDQFRAENARKRAEERIKSSSSETDFRRAETSLRRSIARIQAISE